jgi:hypothetical protein
MHPVSDWHADVGDLVCDCRYQHLRIVWMDNDRDEVELEDGFRCSLPYCCDPPDHPWPHPATPQPKHTHA